jgi:hypothetical protein
MTRKEESSKMPVSAFCGRKNGKFTAESGNDNILTER